MAASNPQLFENPKFRHLLAILGLLWLGIVGILVAARSWPGLSVNLMDPLITPFVYLILFGGVSLWIFGEYRKRGVQVRSLLGSSPSFTQWRAILGILCTLFVFSLGAFQVSFALLSYVVPQRVEGALQQSIFLGAGETAIPWLHNVLTLFLLVVAAPILEEFLFRGFLLHRWGTRWNPEVAVVLSSVLFGVLHSNLLGLTVFGLVMALLYLRSGSLTLVVVVHSLNNAIAASLEAIARLAASDINPNLEDFRASIWLGILLLAVSTPLLVQFVRRNWVVTKAPLPYWLHANQSTSAGS